MEGKQFEDKTYSACLKEYPPSISKYIHAITSRQNWDSPYSLIQSNPLNQIYKIDRSCYQIVQ